jgi:isocitrate dehydrogenase
MNRFIQQRKVISHSKLHRIYNANLDKAGVAFIYKDHNKGWESSLMAVKTDSHIYAIFPCNKQAGSRLTTYAIKYSLDNPLDHVTFNEYPAHIQPRGEF